MLHDVSNLHILNYPKLYTYVNPLAIVCLLGKVVGVFEELESIRTREEKR